MVRMSRKLTRREILSLGGGAGALLAGVGSSLPAQSAERAPMTLALNTSTIRPAPLETKVRIAAEMGYDGIEVWDNELADHEGKGESLEDLGKLIADLGLFVPNVIGLWGCMPADDAERPAALETSKQRMERAVKVGARHIAAIPTPDREEIDVIWAGERYREILEIGDEVGITPAVEFVGFFKGINRLGEAAAIGIESNHPKACLVTDTFHLYRGGSMFKGIRHLNGSFIAVCHFNDAPAFPPQFHQGDKDRIFPGDGVMPLVEFVSDLRAIGFNGPLSLETFNRDHWQQDPRKIARIGIEKMQAIVEASE
jgi:2-keto-myo-inositol isomerase